VIGAAASASTGEFRRLDPPFRVLLARGVALPYLRPDRVVTEWRAIRREEDADLAPPVLSPPPSPEPRRDGSRRRLPGRRSEETSS